MKPIARAASFALIFLFFGVAAFAADPISLPMTVAATGKILVDITINGKAVTCVVDTGSPFFLLLDQVLADQMGLEKKRVAARLRFFAEDQGGETYRVTVPSVQIGPYQYDDVPALTIDNILRATGMGNLELPNFWAQGIIGMAFLQQFRVVIDYPHSRFLLYPPDGSPPSTIPEFASYLAPTVQVGGSNGSVPFLLDTGSSFSVVSESVLAPLGLQFTSSSNSDPLFKGVASADSLSFGGATVQNVTMEVAEHFAQYAGGNFQGIIGYDLLQNFVVDLNFPQGTVTLEEP